MTQQLELTSQPTAKSETSMALAALFTVLLLVAFIPIMVKLSEYEISPNATVFNRFWIATAVLGLWNGVSLIKRRSLNSTPIKNPPYEGRFGGIGLLLLMVAVFSGGQQLLYAWSLTQTSVANSEVLHSLTPLFTTLVGWTFLGQKFDRLFSIGIAIAIVGSIALTANDFSIALDKLQGDGLAFVSAVLWGGYLMATEKLRSQLSIMAITVWSYLLGAVFLLPVVLLAGDELFPHSWEVWLIVAAMGTLGIFIQILITYSLKRLSSGLVATIFLLHPVITAILALIILGETFSLFNLLAFVLILLGVYLATSSKGGVKATVD